jgi:hypothetical protein
MSVGVVLGLVVGTVVGAAVGLDVGAAVGITVGGRSLIVLRKMLIQLVAVDASSDSNFRTTAGVLVLLL